MSSILVVSGKSSGLYIVLEGQVIVVGRDEKCDVQILDEMVSRRHLELAPGEDGAAYSCKDLDSANGVFINGRQIRAETGLRDGDTITIGESKLWYRTTVFPNLDAAMADFKKRGEHGKSTMIR